MLDLTEFSDRELSLQMNNDEFWWNALEACTTMAQVRDLAKTSGFVYTPKQVAELVDDWCDR